ncbi:putative fungal specific transcription protein [Neofusicoccum parvum UCRNP2]|uniref:Putative fungal specific transcription protein n=1 Tax=Botryosphaeria parva (strain UCR-NP2) TaxID=1287680 RepID=R1EWI0_BOTPV|nr:putative fungal specific transcription protein [Neofusicoccum parvum UCRNP2]
MFPMFRQREFFQDFANNTLPPDLIIVMMGLALRASGQSEDQSLLNEIKRIERNLEKKDLDYRNILLSEIKLACLCIIHQFASGPNQYTWMVMGKLARTVYGCKLHQVDGGNGSGNGSGSEGAAHPYFPLASLEELRYVWWTAVRIDMFINVLTCMPCTLDVETAATSLPCTSVSDFTTGVEPDMSLKHIPRTNMIAFWDLLEEAHSAPLADGQRLQLAMCLLLRETTRRLQVILSDIEDPSIETGVAGIQNKCTKICEVLPAWFLDPQLASQSYETMIQHRTRLETILQLRLCCMYSYVPLMCALNEREPNSHGKLVNLWDQFVLHLLAAVDIIRAMPASYYSICDPMMSSGVWILGCVLSLCMMYKAHIVPAIGTQASVTRAEMETGFQALMDTLVGFAKMWPTARKMRESLESVRGWHDLPLSLDEVLKLFGRFQTPLPIHNVDAASPETIYDFDVLGTCKVSLEKDIVTDPQLQPQEWWPIQ